MSENTNKKPRARAQPHLDPVLIAFLVLTLVLVIAKIANAQPVTPTSPPAGGAITGIPALDAVIQLGVPAGLVVYLVVWGLPKMVAEFRAETAAIRAADAEERKAEREGHRADIARLELAIGGVRDRASGPGVPPP